MNLKNGTFLQGGKYRIERVLGQGSFGITYLATTKFTTTGELGTMEVEAHVAVKEFFMNEINNRKSDESTVEGSSGTVFSNYRKKFKTEAQNLAKLDHPNIVKVYDVFDENNTTYYVMEFIDGKDLDHYIKQHGHLPEEEAIGIVEGIGKALGYMHSCNMLHLDMKPRNVMRRSDGRCCLIDFGLSKQYTDDGEPESSTTIGLGTPGYAPLEQSQYKQDGTFPATLDVYALGATCYKMLTGERPPVASDILNQGFPMEKLKALQVSEATVSAVKKAMNPIRVERFDSVASFVNALPQCRFDDEDTEIKKPIHVVIKKKKKNPQTVTPSRQLWPNRNWFTNLAWCGLCLYYIGVMIEAGEWGNIDIFSLKEHDNAFELYMMGALSVSLYFSMLLLHGQRCRWYIPLIVNILPPATIFFSVPYGAALLTLFIKHEGESGWKRLDENRLCRPMLWNKERHILVNTAIIGVIDITLLSLLGVGTNLSTSYVGYNYDMLFSCVFISLLGLLFLLKNATHWGSLIFSGIIFTLIDELLHDHYDNFPLVLLTLMYLSLAGVLFIRKNGKSAWSLMQP